MVGWIGIIKIANREGQYHPPISSYGLVLDELQKLRICLCNLLGEYPSKQMKISEIIYKEVIRKNL